MTVDEFTDVFETLRAIYAPYEKHCVVTAEAPGRYYLATHEVRAGDGYRTAFGGVEIKKRYVSAHLMPVYAHPELLEGISDALKRRMQGKSCFNFSKRDPALLKEFEALVARGFARFKTDGRVSP